MNTTYIVLRDRSSEIRGSIRGPLAQGAAVEGPAFDLRVAPLDAQQASELNQQDNVTVAPSMPMSLIKPFGDPTALAQAVAAGPTWGVQAVRAHTSPFTGDGIIAAVLDTGIDPNHPAFAGIELVRRNFTTGGDDDVHGHGTHCAGTFFGRDVGGVRIGVARGIRRALIGKVLGPGGGSSSDIAKAVQWAAQEGAHVISMSLGVDFPGYVAELIADGYPPEQATSVALQGYRQNVQLFERLASLLRADGNPTILVAAAGNESRRTDPKPFTIEVAPPAIAEGVISVAALGKSPAGHAVAEFSNTGALVSGPGVDIVSARVGGGLTSMSGTSMATPHVAGVAALWAESLRKQHLLKPTHFEAKIITSVSMNGVVAGADPFDVGGGMIIAPQ